jgi:Kef-type K+ transport system membrane component KefB
MVVLAASFAVFLKIKPREGVIVLMFIAGLETDIDRNSLNERR